MAVAPPCMPTIESVLKVSQFQLASAARRLEWLFRGSRLNRCCRMRGVARHDESLLFDGDDRRQHCRGAPRCAHTGWFAARGALSRSSRRTLRLRAAGLIMADDDHRSGAMAGHGLSLAGGGHWPRHQRGLRHVNDCRNRRQRQHDHYQIRDRAGPTHAQAQTGQTPHRSQFM